MAQRPPGGSCLDDHSSEGHQQQGDDQRREHLESDAQEGGSLGQQRRSEMVLTHREPLQRFEDDKPRRLQGGEPAECEGEKLSGPDGPTAGGDRLGDKFPQPHHQRDEGCSHHQGEIAMAGSL